MNIVFFGNTKYSTIGFKIVNTIYPISLVITKKLDKNPIRNLAEKLYIPLVETYNLDEKVIERIKNFRPDFLIVEDYGLILPQSILDLPKFAPLNIHHSLLPKYRGPSPAPAAILSGDLVSGVTIIRMTENVDAGDILAQEKYELSEDEATDSLLIKLNELGANLLTKVMKQYLEGNVNPTPQDHAKATYTKLLTKEDGYFDINNPPSSEKLDRMIRAYYPWPGVWTRWSPSAKATGDKNGRIVKFLPSGMLQMEGKKPISFKDFINGYPYFPIKQLRQAVPEE
ncbi:MAG: methionyl-tRNA formyltransferase [Candidatus Daviesbacteria bacterium]|nr:methionyl-tRNA formyltransferase [Candidatus Daviesbacteria bacterium]